MPVVRIKQNVLDKCLTQPPEQIISTARIRLGDDIEVLSEEISNTFIKDESDFRSVRIDDMSLGYLRYVKNGLKETTGVFFSYSQIILMLYLTLRR